MDFRCSSLAKVAVLCLISASAASFASDEGDKASLSPSEKSEQLIVDNAANAAPLSAAARSAIKRQIMSKPGVFLDMSTLTDNGYVWSNDVIWEGANLPDNKKWQIAGFLFERKGYKGVWLQYAFTANEATGSLNEFKRWFGASGFR